MHENDNFKSARFLQDMCYIQDQVGQGNRLRWYSYIASIKYMLIFPCVLGTVQSPTRERQMKMAGKKEFLSILLSSFHAELTAAWKASPQSIQARISWVVLRWRSMRQVTPKGWTSCGAQQPLKNRPPKWRPQSQPLLPDYASWVDSLTFPSNLSLIYSYSSSLLASSDSLT